MHSQDDQDRKVVVGIAHICPGSILEKHSEDDETLLANAGLRHQGFSMDNNVIEVHKANTPG